MLSRLLIAFLARSKCLLILLLQSPSAVILEPKKVESVTVSIVSPSIFHEEMGQEAMKLKCACSLEESYDKLDSILKSRDIILPTKVHIVKAMVFPVVMYRCES